MLNHYEHGIIIKFEETEISGMEAFFTLQKNGDINRYEFNQLSGFTHASSILSPMELADVSEIKVYYENISMEYEKDGQWYSFVNYVGDDPSTTMKWIGYIMELNPKVALTKKVIEGLALLEESFASGEGVKGPLSSVFYNENDFDIVHINWDVPIVENLPYFPSIVEDIGNRRDPDKRKWKNRVKKTSI